MLSTSIISYALGEKVKGASIEIKSDIFRLYKGDRIKKRLCLWELKTINVMNRRSYIRIIEERGFSNKIAYNY